MQTNNSFLNRSKKKKKEYLGINLTKDVKNLYGENYKTLIKEPEDDSKRYPMLLDWKN